MEKPDRIKDGLLAVYQFEYRDLKDEELRDQIVNFRLRLDQLYRFLCLEYPTPTGILERQFDMLQERLDFLRETYPE